MNERVARYNAKQVNQTLSDGTNMVPNSFPVGDGVEDCKVMIGVGVNRMKKAKKTNGIWCIPELEDPVDMVEVIKKGS